jgi:hypothetical protein
MGIHGSSDNMLWIVLIIGLWLFSLSWYVHWLHVRIMGMEEILDYLSEHKCSQCSPLMKPEAGLED